MEFVVEKKASKCRTLYIDSQRVGYVDDPNLLPCVGNEAYSPRRCGHIALPLEGLFSQTICFTKDM
ncbi:hypothetical protein Bca52824_020742 [Brassica carinata]|uniref:Uncharacterized protein n=1 Tax=Brassica carinata TaxID=52824 RepID=A0A8X8AZV3_BRACI|nr:hypothetical protein Bca52824_020742 [Brassica carinata]